MPFFFRRVCVRSYLFRQTDPPPPMQRRITAATKNVCRKKELWCCTLVPRKTIKHKTHTLWLSRLAPCFPLMKSVFLFLQVVEIQNKACIHGMFAKGGSSCGLFSLRDAGAFLKEHCSWNYVWQTKSTGGGLRTDVARCAFILHPIAFSVLLYSGLFWKPVGFLHSH